MKSISFSPKIHNNQVLKRATMNKDNKDEEEKIVTGLQGLKLTSDNSGLNMSKKIKESDLKSQSIKQFFGIKRKVSSKKKLNSIYSTQPRKRRHTEITAPEESYSNLKLSKRNITDFYQRK